MPVWLPILLEMLLKFLEWLKKRDPSKMKPKALARVKTILARMNECKQVSTNMGIVPSIDYDEEAEMKEEAKNTE